jgi:hypothetical protein
MGYEGVRGPLPQANLAAPASFVGSLLDIHGSPGNFAPGSASQPHEVRRENESKTLTGL